MTIELNKKKLEVSEEIIDSLRDVISVPDILNKISEIEDALTENAENETARIQYQILTERYNNIVGHEVYDLKHPFYLENSSNEKEESLDEEITSENSTILPADENVIIRKSRDANANDKDLILLCITTASNYVKIKRDKKFDTLMKSNQVVHPNPDPTKALRVMQQYKCKPDNVNEAKKFLREFYNDKEFSKINFYI
jgi:hypothetical protein